MATATRQPLTAKQQRVYQYIRDHIVELQRPPTMRDIVDQFRFRSTNAVAQYLEVLQRKQWVALDRFESCGIRLLGVNVTITDAKDNHQPGEQPK